jgi:A/G-specific adenine glycosylase
VKKHCGAFASDRVRELPVKSKPAPKKTIRMKALLCTDAAGQIWVTRRPSTGVLAGLWSLPMAPVENDGFALMAPPFVQVKHVFTHLIWLVDLYREDTPVHSAPTAWGSVSQAMTPDELANVALGGPSLKALIKAGVKLPRRRGAG